MEIGVSYFGCRKTSHLSEELSLLRRRGIQYLVFTFSETDLLFYEGVMHQMFRKARETGFGVWADPWGVAGIFSGETASWFVPYHPETWQVRDDGVPVPHACPNAPETGEFLRRWVDSAAAGGVEWVLWDEPHFWSPGTDYWPEAGGEGHWACRCPHCRERFVIRYGYEMPHELTREVREFRRSSLIGFLDELLSYARAKGLKNAVCWAPQEQLESDLSLEDLASLRALDMFSVDPYWMSVGGTVEDFFRPWVERASALAHKHGRPLQVWLQGFRVPRGREGELLEAFGILEEMGIDYLAIWHHNGMTSLLPEDPPVLEGVLDEILTRGTG